MYVIKCYFFVRGWARGRLYSWGQSVWGKYGTWEYILGLWCTYTSFRCHVYGRVIYFLSDWMSAGLEGNKRIFLPLALMFTDMKFVGSCLHTFTAFKLLYSNLHRFWPLILVEESSMRTTEGRKGGRKRREAVEFVPFPFLLSLPVNFRLSDWLRGSNSHISETKNAGPGYTYKRIRESRPGLTPG
jgi:hypothetical protein